MSAAVRFCGPARYQLRSAAALCQSLVQSSTTRVSNGRRPGTNWFFAVGTCFLKKQLEIAFQMGDVRDARRFLDCFVVASDAPQVTITSVVQEQFRGSWFVPRDARPYATVLYFHGGGYAFYPKSYVHLIRSIALASKARTFALDYRLAPEHRFPLQLEDALNAYLWLLATGTTPGNLIAAGDSAGANLVLALLLALRDANLPQPALAIALSPATDFAIERTSALAGESADWVTWPMLAQWSDWFCDAAQHRNPLVSPVYADLRGLAPIYIQTGRAEILFDSIQAFADVARRQQAPLVLESWEHMNHDFQMFAPYVPQSAEALRRLGGIVEFHANIRELLPVAESPSHGRAK